MEVLAINCGSSTLKFELMEMGEDASSPSHRERRLAWGIVDKIGRHGSIEFDTEQGKSLREVREVADHSEATRLVLAWLDSANVYEAGGLNAVGHRVVHGGERFAEPTLIDSQVLEAIDEVSNLAPLHNVPSLAAIREARSVLGTAIPMVATFDTAFHRTLPEQASA